MTIAVTDARLPFELISNVLDYVDILELLRLSHVCCAWRSAARAHPLFWRDIRLTLFYNPAMVELFLARLSAHKSGTNVVIYSYSFGGQDDDVKQRQLCLAVLPAVQQNMWRILHLCFGYTSQFSPELFAALTLPAPMLQRLTLAGRPNDSSEYVLPEDFLGGHAPQLKQARILDIVFPERAVSAFQNVERLYVESERYEYDLPNLACHFPTLQHLHVTAHTCFAPHASDALSRHPLTTLDVRVADKWHAPFFDTFRAEDLAAITHLTCSAYIADGWMHAFLSVFSGQVALTVRDLHEADGGEHELSFEISSAQDRDSERTRTILISQADAMSPQNERWPEIVAGVFTPELLARVSRFRMLSRRACIVPEIGDALPACEILEVGFSGYYGDGDGHLLVASLEHNDQPHALQFPAVRTVICTAVSRRSPVTVSAEGLSTLLARVILSGPSPLKVIELDGVQLTGDVAALKRAYGCEVRLITI